MFIICLNVIRIIILKLQIYEELSIPEWAYFCSYYIRNFFSCIMLQQPFIFHQMRCNLHFFPWRIPCLRNSSLIRLHSNRRDSLRKSFFGQDLLARIERHNYYVRHVDDSNCMFATEVEAEAFHQSLNTLHTVFLLFMLSRYTD